MSGEAATTDPEGPSNPSFAPIVPSALERHGEAMSELLRLITSAPAEPCPDDGRPGFQNGFENQAADETKLKTVLSFAQRGWFKMAWKPADFAAFIRNENARAYLTGTALAAMHQMEHVAKAGVAKKAIIADSKVYFGGDEKATAAGLKSQLDAMANNWVVAGDVLRLLTPDDRASLRRQQVKGAVATMVDIMTDHMAKLGFASFTYAQFRDHIRYADKAAMDADLADKAAAEAERQQAVAEAEPQAAAEAAAEPETVSEPANAAVDEPIVGVDLIFRQVEGLDDAELLDLAHRINALMVSRAETAALIVAQEDRKAA